jgi:hypothetical protein
MSQITTKVSPNKVAVAPAFEPISPRAFDIQQASTYSGCTVWNLRTSVWAGKLRARLSGKRLLFLREDLDSFILSLPEVRSGRSVNSPRPARRKRAA